MLSLVVETMKSQLRRKLIFVLVSLQLCFVQQLSAQQYSVGGVVRDATTNEPLPFANVHVKETTFGTATDNSGRFTFNLPSGRYALQCSYVGYKTDTVAISVAGDMSITFKLSAIDVLMQDVTVYAHREEESGEKEISAMSLQSEQIKEVTSTIPDVLRSIQMLPGVSTNNEFSAKYNVRGGNQDENLVLVNDTKVYEPYHLKEAPNASIGVFNVDMINKMDLITGGFPARYGDRMSSVLNIDYREGNKDRFKGNASVSILEVDGLAEGPVGSAGSVIVAARKSYLEYAMKMVNADPAIHPSFYDVQGVLGYSVSSQSKLLFKFIASKDDFTDDPHTRSNGPYTWSSIVNGRPMNNSNYWIDSTNAQANYSSTMLAMQSVNVLSADAVLKAELSLYDQRDEEHSADNSHYTYTGSGVIQQFYQNAYGHLYLNSLHIRTWEFSPTLDLQITPPYSIKAGLSHQWITYNQDQIDRNVIGEYTNLNRYPDTTYTNRIESPLDSLAGHITGRSFKDVVYVENVVQLGDQFLVNIGGRADYFDFDKDLTWSPRVNVSYKIAPAATVRGAWGYYYQSPIYNQLAYSFASDTNTQSQRAIHYVAGADWSLPLNAESNHFLKLKVEVYHKDYDRLINASVNSDGRVNYSRRNDAVGRTNGLDVCFTYSHPSFYGWISYSLLKAEQKMLNDSLGWFPRYTDQRHTVAVVGELDCGSQWNLGLRLVYGSGYAFTPSTASYNTAQRYWEWVPGQPNSSHMPAYRRVDARLTRNFSLFGLAASGFLDVNNLFNWVNIQSYRYRIDSQGHPYIGEMRLWPILPTLGLSVKM